MRTYLPLAAALFVLLASSRHAAAEATDWSAVRLPESPGSEFFDHSDMPRPLFRGQDELEPIADDEPLTTDRPDFTEASSVVGVGRVQFENGYVFSYNDSELDGSITTSHSYDFLWRIGVSENVELRIAWAYASDRMRPAAGSIFRTDGAEDLYLGAKIALTEQCCRRPETAVIIQGTVPSGAAARTSDEVEFGINYLYSWSLSDTWDLAGSTGFDTLTAAGDDTVVWHQSLAVGHSLTECLGVYVEYFGLYNSSATVDTVEHFINGGFAYLVHNDLQLDISFGHGISDDATDLFGGAGLSVRY